MTDHRDRNNGPEPDPDADRWSAWLPPLDPMSDHTGAADPGQQHLAPPLPQSPAPTMPSAPPVGQRPGHYRWAPPSPQSTSAIAPNNYLAMAILSILFGFPFFGIIAVFKAMSVNPLWARGRTHEAVRASRLARNWAIAAFAVTALWFVCSALMMAFFGMIF